MTYEFDSDIKMLEGMKKPYVISISSVSGGGKTTIVNLLKDKLPNTAVISFDDYDESEVYLDRDINVWSREGNDENEWHTQPIADDIEKLISAQYDTIILDYPFGHRNACVGKYIDLAVFIDTPLDVALTRRIIRDYTSRNENSNFGLADVEEVSLK
ncbi:MAG: AAA family ATPase, partial [Lachnospiraceae bacterium]|nr:AAA family ATPase [Lachnospiraceae bacterium]